MAFFQDLAELQESATRQNFSVLAARHQAEAAHNAIDAAKGYPDPVLKIGGFLQPLETRNGPTQAKLSIQQPLPWSESLQAQEDVARAAARSADAQAIALQRQIRRQCAELWWELAYVHRALQILEKNLELLESTHAVVESRLEVGEARLPELLRVEMESMQLADRQRRLRDRSTPLRTRLNALLGLADAEVRWTQPQLPTQSPTPEPSIDLGMTPLWSEHPELIALSAQATGKHAMWQQSRSAERAQIGVGLDWTLVGDGNALSPDSGEDAVALMVSIQLPLHRGRDQARSAQARAEWQMAEQAKRDRELKLNSQWQQAWFDHDNAQATIRLLQQELSTRVESALETELAAFETGSASFEGLLESLRLLLDFQLREAEARKLGLQSQARLMELGGMVK